MDFGQFLEILRFYCLLSPSSDRAVLSYLGEMRAIRGASIQFKTFFSLLNSYLPSRLGRFSEIQSLLSQYIIRLLKPLSGLFTSDNHIHLDTLRRALHQAQLPWQVLYYLMLIDDL